MGMPMRNDPDEGRGLYQKFEVRRVDQDAAARHEGCEYFVLDLMHDKLAVAALEAYESAAMKHGYNALAEDLRLKRAMLKAGVADDPNFVRDIGDPRGNPR